MSPSLFTIFHNAESVSAACLRSPSPKLSAVFDTPARSFRRVPHRDIRELLDVETPYFAAPAPLDQRGRAITPVRVLGQCIYISQLRGGLRSVLVISISTGLRVWHPRLGKVKP